MIKLKYSLSSRQKQEYLEKCDEIKVMWNDRDVILDLVTKYPGKTINLCRYYIHSNDEIDWKEIINYKKLAQGNFIFGLSYIDELLDCRLNDIDCYYLEPIRTFRELRGVAALGVTYAIIDAPLFFQMDQVKEIGVPLRATANLAIRELLPYEDGVPGPWIRPEDVNLYEPYIDVLEFSKVDLEQERALFRIYAEQGQWPGDLGMIIKDLNHLGVNRMLTSDLTNSRLNCGQKCQAGSPCRLCWRALDLANPDLIRNYQSSLK